MHNHYLAHSEDLHNEITTDLYHYLTEPYVAVPLFIAGLIGVYLLLRNVLRLKLTTTTLIFLGIFLVFGIGLYAVVPAISIISLIAGIGLALFFAFSLITS